jgi:GT2 family glycosyltransferase
MQTNTDFRVIVIDDASTDGTNEMISDEFPNVILLQGYGNLWWTGAINKGIIYTLSVCEPNDYILVLNDDLVVPKDYIANLFQLTSEFPDSIIGSVIVDINDHETILNGGINVNPWNAKRWILNSGRKISSIPKGYFTGVTILTGRGVLFPAKVFREIGLYNKKHYQQYGDTEFPKRAEKAGYRLIVSYNAIVFSYPLRTMSFSERDTYRLRDFKNYFFGVRSNANLKTRFWFAYDTSPNIFQGTIYFFFDFARILFHFLRHLSR